MVRDADTGTLLAPTNDTFDALSGDDLERLNEDPSVLGLHFLDQRIGSEDARIHKPQNGKVILIEPLLGINLT